MNKRVISVDYGRDFCYVISMDNDKIFDIIYIPNDYSFDDTADLILSACPINSEKDIVCYDAHGVGLFIGDALEGKIGYSYQKCLRPMYMYFYQIAQIEDFLDRAKKRLDAYKKNSQLSPFAQAELDKIRQELDNLEYVLCRNGQFMLAKKDESISRHRASCFLMGLYCLFNENNGG